MSIKIIKIKKGQNNDNKNNKIRTKMKLLVLTQHDKKIPTPDKISDFQLNFVTESEMN
jgi:hypothetical protein